MTSNVHVRKHSAHLPSTHQYRGDFRDPPEVQRPVGACGASLQIVTAPNELPGQCHAAICAASERTCFAHPRPSSGVWCSVFSGCHALRTVQHGLLSSLFGGPTAIKVAQRLSCACAQRRGRVRCACRLAGSLGSGWQACTHGHTAAGTDTSTHARLRIQTETRRHSRTHAARTHKCMHTNTQAHEHKHTSGCTHS
jgi:hypothetical protein